MTDEFRRGDVVILRHGIPEDGIEPGTRAVVVDVHRHPRLAYEVEVVDQGSGETRWWGSVVPENLEPAT